MLRRLYEILFVFKEYLLLSCCLSIAIALLATNDTPQVRVLRTVAVGAVAYLQDLFTIIPNYFSLREENRVLREMNLTLTDELSRLREAKLENIRLRQMLHLKEQTPYKYVFANVVGKQLGMMRNSITIDAGDNQGVRINMPIVTDAGLVGRVVATSSGYAIGQIMLNRNFRASARVQRTRVDGIVLWTGGDNLILKNVAKTLDVQRGDVVLTSEYSSIFPHGIRIGIVSRVDQSTTDLFQTVEITPGVDFSRLEEVFVITQVPDTSRAAVEQFLLPR